MKKIKYLLLLTMLTVLSTGCADKKEHGLNPKDPQNVVVWNYYNGNQLIAFEEMVEEFNSTVGKEKGIIIYTESKGSVTDLIEAVNNAVDKKVGADAMPDIFQCYLDTAVDIDDKDILVNLDDYVSSEKKAEYYEDYIEEGTFGADNGWKLFPVAKSTEVLVLNKTDWDKFAEATGATTDELSTWEGCAKVGEEYYQWSGGKSFMGRDSFANYMIVGSKQLGTELFAVENGKATIQCDETVMRRLWDNYYVPFVKGYYGQKGRYRSDDIKLGDIIGMISSSSSTTYFPTEVTTEDGSSSYPIDYLVLPLPNFEGTEPYAVQQGANMAVAKSNDREEYASVVFLEWFTESEQNMKFAVDSGYLPVKKADCSNKAYETYMSSNGNSESSIAEDTAKICFQQIEDGHLYTSKGFSNANASRNIIDSTMIKLAVADRDNIIAQVASGATEEEVLAPYLTDEYFKQWYEDTKQQLEATIQ